MTYKYHLGSGSESKAKNEIDNQNPSHFDSIIDLNQRIVTCTCIFETDLPHC